MDKNYQASRMDKTHQTVTLGTGFNEMSLIDQVLRTVRQETGRHPVSFPIIKLHTHAVYLSDLCDDKLNPSSFLSSLEIWTNLRDEKEDKKWLADHVDGSDHSDVAFLATFPNSLSDPKQVYGIASCCDDEFAEVFMPGETFETLQKQHEESAHRRSQLLSYETLQNTDLA